MMPEQLIFKLVHKPALGFEDFLVAPSNQAAAAWIERWPEWPGQALAIHGPEGCGKTHLAHVWRAQSDARVLNGQSLEGVAADLAPGDCIAVEDFPEGGDEVALLHLFNWCFEQGGRLLLTGRYPPARWAVALDDLRSRLRGLQAVPMGPPDDALLGAVMVKLFADRQVAVGRKLVDYLLPRIERSFAGARAAVSAIDALALARKRAISVPLARAALDRMEAGL